MMAKKQVLRIFYLGKCPKDIPFETDEELESLIWDIHNDDEVVDHKIITQEFGININNKLI